MQHKRISVSTQLGHDERHTLSHQSRDKGHIPRQSIELGNEYAALRYTGGSQSRGKLRPPIQGIATFAGFHLDVFAKERHALGLGKPDECGALSLDAKPRLPLLPSRNPEVGNRAFHTKRHTTVCGLYERSIRAMSLLISEQ
jgi:hypothetical protein